MEPILFITINHHTFSRYECEIACALQLYIRNANGQKPSDDTLGLVIKSLRGEVNGEPLPCGGMVWGIEHFASEGVRAVYLSVGLTTCVPPVYAPLHHLVFWKQQKERGPVSFLPSAFE